MRDIARALRYPRYLRAHPPRPLERSGLGQWLITRSQVPSAPRRFPAGAVEKNDKTESSQHIVLYRLHRFLNVLPLGIERLRLFKHRGRCGGSAGRVPLELAPGGITALVGRSGCGKTTLLNLCGAMDFPTSGEVEVAGLLTANLGDAELTGLRRGKIGFVFQFFQLLPFADGA